MAEEMHLQDGVKRHLKPWALMASAAVLVPALLLSITLWRVNRATRIASMETAAARNIAFTSTPVRALAPAGIEAIATPAAFRDLAVYRNRIYLSGPAGLTVYDEQGKLLHSYRAGLELPAAELGNMSAGVAAGGTEYELFIAAHRAGVLAFNDGQLRQIRPSEGELANVNAVLALTTGRVLMGTDRGLLVYDGRTVVPFTGLKSAHVTALAGIEGDVWIGTLGDGVFHYHAGQLDALKDTLPDPQVLSLAWWEKNGYVGTPLGVAEFKEGRRTRVLADGLFASAIAADARCLSVGTEDEGVVQVPLATRGCSEPGTWGGSGAIRRIAAIGTERYVLTDDAVYRINGQRVIGAVAGALANRNISALAVGRGGALWVGYFDRGLDILEPDFEHVTHLEDDHLFSINRIVQDADRTAVATANGLLLFDSSNRVRQVLGRKDGLMADHITDVVLRKDGMIAATPAGLSFIDSSGIRGLYAFHGLVNNHVYALATAGDRTMVGTLGGISSVENDTVRVNYDTSNSALKHNWITAVVWSGGEWFAGTYGAGVLRMDADGRWHTFNDLKGLIVNPNALLATADRIYAGSLGRGLFVFDRGSGRWTSVTAGLPSLNVTALAEHAGYLYAGTDNGLVRIREGALQ